MATEPRHKDGVPIVSAMDRLDSTNAQAFHDQLEAAARSAERAVVIDMTDLIYISSMGLRMILQVVKEMENQDIRIAFCSLSEDVREVFETSGFSSRIDIRPSLEEAIAAVSD